VGLTSILCGGFSSCFISRNSATINRSNSLRNSQAKTRQLLTFLTARQLHWCFGKTNSQGGRAAVSATGVALVAAVNTAERFASPRCFACVCDTVSVQVFFTLLLGRNGPKRQVEVVEM
jgi:hypothetical protein